MMITRPDGAGPREWDRFFYWYTKYRKEKKEHVDSSHCWASWVEGRHDIMVAAELRQQDLMKRNTELVEKNRELEAQVKRLKTVLKEEL